MIHKPGDTDRRLRLNGVFIGCERVALGLFKSASIGLMVGLGWMAAGV